MKWSILADIWNSCARRACGTSETIEAQVVATIFDRMQSFIYFFLFFQTIYLGTADDKLSYGQDGRMISFLLKKIWDLEERDREFNRKLEQIDVLKEGIDEAQRQLANMEELEYRLQKSEERIRTLEKCEDSSNAHCKMNKSDTIKVYDTNRTYDNMDIGSSASVLIRQDVSNIEPQQAEMGKRLAKLVSFENRIQTVKHTAATKDIKRTVTRKVAFTAMFSSVPVSVTPGRSLQFDRVDYNEGNAYDAKMGIFTCPVSGTYFFFTNVLSMPNSGQVETEIVVEGLGKGTTSAFRENNYAQGSTAAAVHCDVGQRVWVQGAYGSQTFGTSFSSFTGVLLWPSDAATNSN